MSSVDAVAEEDSMEVCSRGVRSFRMDSRRVRGVNLARMESNPETSSASEDDPSPMLIRGTGVGVGAGLGGRGGGTIGGIGTGAGIGAGVGSRVGDTSVFHLKRFRMELG